MWLIYWWAVRTNKWAGTWQNQQKDFVPSEDSDQPVHLPSLISVFIVHSVGSEGPKVSSCGQQWLWSDWVDAQADLSLRWVHSHFAGFVMSQLIFGLPQTNERNMSEKDVMKYTRQTF